MSRVELEVIMYLDTDPFGDFNLEDEFDVNTLIEVIRDDLLTKFEDHDPEILIRDYYEL